MAASPSVTVVKAREGEVFLTVTCHRYALDYVAVVVQNQLVGCVEMGLLMGMSFFAILEGENLKYAKCTVIWIIVLLP